MVFTAKRVNVLYLFYLNSYRKYGHHRARAKKVLTANLPLGFCCMNVGKTNVFLMVQVSNDGAESRGVSKVPFIFTCIAITHFSFVSFYNLILAGPFLLQIFVFSLNPKNEDWRFYNWDKVTTVVMVGYLDMKVVCHAHQYGARAITIGEYTS